MQKFVLCGVDEKDSERIASVVREFGSAYSFESLVEWKALYTYLNMCKPDLLALDIDRMDVDGIRACEVLREDFPNLKIVVTSSKRIYAIRCFEIGIFDFWLKPYTKERIAKSLKLAQTVFYRYAYKLYVRTMPRLELFVNMKPMYFRRPKCKELFAYLVDKNGTPCSTKEIVCDLWPGAGAGDKHSAVCRNTFIRLKEELESWGIGDVLLSTRRGMRMLDTSCYEADIRLLLRGDLEVMKLYDGRYLDEYSWSEEKNANIARFVEENKKQH